MNASIVVIGSSNTDMVIHTDHIPKHGETILGGKFFMNAGGKGANQAVAAARLRGDVIFVAKTGRDIFGEQAKNQFNKEGIDTRFIGVDPANPSGVALIIVDKKGENSIVVAPGANGMLTVNDLKKSFSEISRPGFLLMQLEIPIETVQFAAEYASQNNIKVILNPAPASTLPDSIFPFIDYITPNEIEAEMLTGVTVSDEASAELAAKALASKGVKTVVITRGEEGALLLHQNKFYHVPVVKVNPVDTTAAGDVFNGAMAVSLCEGNDIQTAVAFACRAAAISVTRLGAQSSAPYRNELS
jgi:ribokinase